MGWFSSESTKMKLAPEYPEAGESRKWLLDLLKQGVPNIPTKQIPGLTGTELSAQDMLSQYLGSDLPESFRTALTEMTRTATEPVDITKMPEFEPIVSRVGREGDLRTNQLMRRLQMGGALSSSPGGKMIGRETSRTMEEMAGTLAPYAEAERGRRFSAMMGLPGMAEWEEGAPVRRMGAVSAFGGLPRQIETQQQEQEYLAQMMKIMFPYQTQGQIAQFLAQLKPEYYSQTEPGGPGWDMAQLGIQTLGQMGQKDDTGTESEEKKGFLGGQSDASDAAMIAKLAMMFSDIRLKENVKPINNALDKVQKLDGKTFNFKGNHLKDGGIIAQDLEEVLPEVVGQKNGYKTVNYIAIIALLVNAVKELNKKVENQLCLTKDT